MDKHFNDLLRETKDAIRGVQKKATIEGAIEDRFEALQLEIASEEQSLRTTTKHLRELTEQREVLCGQLGHEYDGEDFCQLCGSLRVNPMDMYDTYEEVYGYGDDVEN